LNVLQSRLINRCSGLNSDLYRANLIPNALCSCGKSDETAKHFLLHCKNYIGQRNIFLIGIRENSNDLPIYLLYCLAMKFSTTKKIQNFSYKFKNSFKTQVVSQ
jgi:hypothetical protein